MKKNNYILCVLGVFLFVCLQSAGAFEVRPFFQFDFPSKVNIKKDVNDVKQEKKWSTDPVYIGGAEMLFSAEFAPIRYGFGLGYKSAQKKGSQSATPAVIPVWGNLSFGAYNKPWYVIPYAVVRAGSMAPLTGNGNWWERPLNFFVDGGAGVLLPYNIGLEVNYGYSSMMKSFESDKTKFRVSSGRIGVQLSVGFELSHDRTYKSDQEKEEEKTVPADTNTYEVYSSYMGYEDSYSSTPEPVDSTEEEPVETPSEETNTDSTAAAEPAPETTEEAVAEAASEPEEPEVAEEPEPEAAPVEEPKPETKKKASKKSTKKASKKSSKKSSKKPSRKSKKKK